MIKPEMIQEILAGYSLHVMGIHGLSHWARVLETGLRIAEKTGANPEIVSLFAVFHDSRRMNESTDSGHGRRGGDLAVALRDKYIDLSYMDFERLQYACDKHTDGLMDDDATVQGVTEGTLYEHSLSLRNFECIVGRCNSKQITRNVIDKFILERTNEVKRVTLNKDIRNIKTFVIWCHEQRYLKWQSEV
jgi:hypothetical protein